MDVIVPEEQVKVTYTEGGNTEKRSKYVKHLESFGNYAIFCDIKEVCMAQHFVVYFAADNNCRLFIEMSYCLMFLIITESFFCWAETEFSL